MWFVEMLTIHITSVDFYWADNVFFLQIKQEDEEFCHKLGSVFVFNQDVEMGIWTVAETNQTLG